MGELIVTYLYHSAFSVELNDVLLVFDYAPGSHGTLNREALAKYRQVVVLVSHSHGDHFDPVIFDWAEAGRVHYVLGFDISTQWPGRRLKPGEGTTVGDVSVKAYDSTDLGVSFLVKLGDYTVFHAGDLNLWHWREVSTLREIEQAERDFHAAVKPLQGKEIDLAFFPVDPRQGSLYDAGANFFVMEVKPRVLIPMHWQERVDVANEYVRKNRTRRVEMVALTQPGDTVVIGKSIDQAEEAPSWSYQTITKGILEDRESGDMAAEKD
ncbi:MAG: MBL fold metallo-hydrolase [Clostridia bacterium]|nr:MBL fold metallo-hydrolase [Clostridia bacterium]